MVATPYSFTIYIMTIALTFENLIYIVVELQYIKLLLARYLIYYATISRLLIIIGLFCRM